jgi:hypothetical protein
VLIVHPPHSNDSSWASELSASQQRRGESRRSPRLR